MMSRYRTAIADRIPTTPAVNPKSQTRPSGSSSARGDSTPPIAAERTAAGAVTTNAGSDAMMPAIGNAGRGQGVKRTYVAFVITDDAPIVSAAWKNDQTE